MRTVICLTVTLCLAALAAGCGQRSHESVQKDISAAAEELAAVMGSNLSNEAKLAKVKDIAKRLTALAEEAKQLGAPSKLAQKKVNRTRGRDLAAAEKLRDAAKTLAGDAK